MLSTALLAISLSAQAQASPWWWPSKTAAVAPAATPVKTVQLALPTNNGGVISVTVPSKTASANRAAVHLTPAALARRAHDSTVNEHDEERIAADLARHF